MSLRRPFLGNRRTLPFLSIIGFYRFIVKTEKFQRIVSHVIVILIVKHSVVITEKFVNQNLPACLSLLTVLLVLHIM